MKSQKLDFNSTFTSSINVQIKEVNCLNGYKAIHACSKRNCNMNAFLCIDDDCKCKQYHQKCLTECSVRNIKSILSMKLEPLKEIKKIIQVEIQRAVDQISDFGQKIKADLYKLNCVFTETQSLVMNALKNGQANQVNGNHIYQIQESLNKSIKNQNGTIQQQIKQCWNLFRNQIQGFKQSINDILFKDTKSTTNVKQFKNSTILKTNEDIQKLMKFFHKKIMKVELLYRATRDSFKVAKFHEKCDNIADTLTIVQTDKDKIFGGYTPHIWKSLDQYVDNDSQLKSFIFQLNNNHKLTLKPDQSKYAIYRSSRHGPVFGTNAGNDFVICEDSNINKPSYSRIGSCYQNSLYLKDDANSRDKFAGGQYFTINQYEVWKITFY